MLVASQRRAHEQRERQHEQHDGEARCERFRAVGVDRLVAEETLAEARMFSFRAGNMREEVSEEGGVLGHGSVGIFGDAALLSLTSVPMAMPIGKDRNPISHRHRSGEPVTHEQPRRREKASHLERREDRPASAMWGVRPRTIVGEKGHDDSCERPQVARSQGGRDGDRNASDGRPDRGRHQGGHDEHHGDDGQQLRWW